MNQNFKNMVSKLGVELLQNVRDAGNQVIDDAVFEERVWGFSRAVDSMLECGIPTDKIIAMLQKYWDLRLSEASAIVEVAQKDRITD